MWELGLEVVDADVVLDGLQLRCESELRLHQGRQLSLILPLQLVDLVEVLLHHNDVGRLDDLDNVYVVPSAIPVTVILVLAPVVLATIPAAILAITIATVLVLILTLDLILVPTLVRGFRVLGGCCLGLASSRWEPVKVATWRLAGSSE